MIVINSIDLCSLNHLSCEKVGVLTNNETQDKIKQ